MSIRLSEITGDIVIGSGSRFTIGSDGKPTINGRANWVGSIPSTGQSHVIEQGSNANGLYIRFANGDQICYRNAIITSLAVTNAYGNIFNSGAQSWTFPAAFSDAATVVTAFAAHGADARPWADRGGVISTTSTSVYVYAGASITQDTRITFFAAGRWY
jgi:hypothetical protein